MHDTYEITTLPPTTHTTPNPAHGPASLPPGVEIVTLPNGTRTLAYTHPTTPPTPAGAAPPPPAPQQIPAWARTTALLAPTVGGGVAAAGVGLSYAAPGLIAMTHALWSAAALIVAAVIAAPVVLRTTRRTPVTTTHITQNITATGLFGRANGTINHR
ncbi:hypothetical protein JNUCC64_18190 [Streptomyces sp. JNUCC 64]